MSLDTLVAEAKALEILRPIRAIDVHCPNCGTRLQGLGECPDCGLVGRTEAQLRGMDEKAATALLERSIARRKAWTPAKTRAKSAER